MLNKNLREQVKLLKALQGISYKKIAELMELETQSFYHWLRGYYNFSEQRQADLKNIILTIKE